MNTHTPTRRFMVGLVSSLMAAAASAGCSSASAASAAAAEAKKMMVYISVGGEKHIAIYEMDQASGKLTPRGKADLAGSPGALTLNPARDRLYASLRPDKRVETLKLDPATGQLTSLGATQIAANAVYLTIDKPAKNLLTSDYGGNIAASYPLRPDGTVSDKANNIVETGKNPHSIITDPSSKFAFVPLCGVDEVLQFKLAADGKLVPNNPPSVKEDPVDGPRHITFHPSGKFVYVVNEKSSSLTAYSFDAKKGTLTKLQKLSTLPADNTVKNTCADIHVTPDGRYVYASNRGHDSLAGYRVDEKTGKLTHIGNTPTEKTPRDFGMDPAGRFVIAAGQGSGKIATYRIDPASGKLQPLEVLEVGKGPAWVEIVPLN